MAKDKQKYELKLLFTQSTDDRVDNRTLTEEYSDDANVHALKTQILTEELTSMMNRFTTRMTNLAMEAGAEDLDK